MLKWLAENHTWIFSGVGVLLIGWVGNTLYRYYRKHPPEERALTVSMAGTHAVNSNVAVGSNISQIVNMTKSIAEAVPTIKERLPTGPTPEEASHYRSALPPYQQNEAMKHYFGLRVGLPVQFISIDQLNSGRWMLIFRFYGENNHDYSVYAHFENDPTERFPRLRTLPKDSWVWIEGEIGIAPSLFVVLVDKMQFE